MFRRSLYYGTKMVIKRCDFSITILPMPKLSPSQVDSSVTKLVKWYVKENSEVAAYSLLCEVETDALTEDSSSATAKLDIEIQEGSYIAKLLHKEGDEVKPGLPIAILCEEKEDLDRASKFPIDRTADVYLSQDLRLTGFQAYVKTLSPSCG